MSTSVEAYWVDGGEVTLDQEERPLFCRYEAEPLVYQLEFAYGDGAVATYVGETGGAYGRFAQYRSGLGGSTNVNIHREIVECITRGGTVWLLASTDADVTTDGGGRAADLREGNDRRLVESATIVSLRSRGRRVLNAIVEDEDGDAGDG